MNNTRAGSKIPAADGEEKNKHTRNLFSFDV
jgi:hypothetical protein